MTAGSAFLAIGYSPAAWRPQCGNTAAGFHRLGRGVQGRGRGQGREPGHGSKRRSASVILRNDDHSADRGQKSFKLSLSIHAKARRTGHHLQGQHDEEAERCAVPQASSSKYGVPAGPLIAIWGMETGFGSFIGNQDTLRALATLAYDCRRSEFSRSSSMPRSTR